MNDDIDLDQGFVEDKASSVSQSDKAKLSAKLSANARRRLEERLEESRIKKQTRDYDFDLD